MNLNATANPYEPAHSQQSIAAHVSMIVVNLPFPPLPIVAIKGDDTTAIANGHDLLSSAIACSLVQPMYSANSTDVQANKMQILHDLYEDISKAYKIQYHSPQSKAGDMAVMSAYNAYCFHFRRYMALYPGSRDLRIFNMDDVPRDSFLISQGKEHLKAWATSTENDADVHSKTTKCNTYRDLILNYIIVLGQFKQIE